MDTRAIQRALIALGYDPGPDDGIDGPRTRAAVSDFQRANGLWYDGLAGPVTQAALTAALVRANPDAYRGSDSAAAFIVADAAEIAAGAHQIQPAVIWRVRHDGRLTRNGAPAVYRGTPNIGGVLSPRFLVMHFTAGSYGGAVNWLTDRAARASAHFVIGEAGETTQLAATNVVTWHAGRSEWRGVSGLNNHSVGIELANFGQLSGNPGSLRFGRVPVPDSRAIRAAHRNGGPARYWHTYPQSQIDAAVGIARAIIAAHPTITEIVGHDDIAPGRKTDPGPAFDMPAFRKAVLG